MTQFLPPNLLNLFNAREAIEYKTPLQKLPFEKKTVGYFGLSHYLSQFEDPKDTPPPVKIESREEKAERKRREKDEKAALKREQQIALWNPKQNPEATEDPYATIFVGRINYDTTESKLRREFETYGAVKKVVMIQDGTKVKSRGYAFVEYENEKDMHDAYKHADGKKIDGRRVVVDVERGRTVETWLPRRLGGGLGSTRLGGPDVNIKASGRDDNRDRDRDRRDEERERERERRGDSGRDRRPRDEPKRRDRSPRRDRKGRSRSPRRERDRGTRDRSDRGDRDKNRKDRSAKRDRDDWS